MRARRVFRPLLSPTLSVCASASVPSHTLSPLSPSLSLPPPPLSLSLYLSLSLSLSLALALSLSLAASLSLSVRPAPLVLRMCTPQAAFSEWQRLASKEGAVPSDDAYPFKVHAPYALP